MASTKKPTTRKGYGAMLYHAIEAHGGHYCPDCHRYVQADHAICDRNWFTRSLEKLPDGTWGERAVPEWHPGRVELAGPCFYPLDPIGAEVYAPTVPEPFCEAVAA